jgi:hypothetical protein
MAEAIDAKRLEWRARREARRQRQREENLRRAEQMHQARLGFKRPPAAASRDLPKLLIGCSGWFYWHWRDCIYKGIERQD